MEGPHISQDARIFRSAPKLTANTKGQPPSGRNVGKLMNIMNVPVEVFLEIISHLQPIDLLQLSRVSLELRQMLMVRRMRWLWVASLKRLEPPPPDCPDDFPEPAFVSLVFEKNCMACGAGRANHKVCYANRIRFCGPCWKENVKSGTKLVRDLGVKKETEIFKLVPHAAQYLPWVGSVLEELRQDGGNKYYEPVFKVVLQELLDHRRSQSVASLGVWIAQRAATSLLRLNFHRAMGKWEYESLQGKHQAQNTAAAARQAAIEKKLLELGYKDEDLPRDHPRYERLVSQPRPLTDRIWKQIETPLIEVIEYTKINRKARAFEKKWGARMDRFYQFYIPFLAADRNLHPWKRTLPHHKDAIRLPEVTAFITSMEPDVELTVEECEAALADKMDEYARPYRKRMQHELAKIWRHEYGLDDYYDSDEDEYRRPATTSKRKGKGKQTTKQKLIAAHVSQYTPIGEIDPVEDLALLKNATVLFACTSMFCLPTLSSKWLTYVGFLEHLQKYHNGVYHEELDLILGGTALPAPYTTVDDMGCVLAALGLPEDADVYQLEEALAGWEGCRVRCECGSEESLAGTLIPYIMLSNMIDHVDYAQIHAEDTDAGKGKGKAPQRDPRKHRFIKI